MKKVVLFGGILSLTLMSNIIIAEPLLQTPLDNDNIDLSSNRYSKQTIKSDLLRQAKLSNQKKIETDKILTELAIKDLATFEALFVQQLMSANVKTIPDFIKLYKENPKADYSLIDWGNAILLRNTNLSNSIGIYRKLISHFSENDFIRYQLAETLFYNQEYEAAKLQFERLKSSQNMTPEDITIIEQYIETIYSKNTWSFYINGSFLNDKNLSNSAKVGTTYILPDGGVLKQSTDRQKGQGVYFNIGADKNWALSDGKYLTLSMSLSNKLYWNNKKYNDINAYIGFGMGYSNARYSLDVIPYIQKRWYAGGISSLSGVLKQYSNNYGINVATSYWIKPDIKYSFNYDYSYKKYDRDRFANLYNGSSHTLTNSILYYPSSTQYWMLSLDLTKDYAIDESNNYHKIGSRLAWGQEWPLGMASSISLGIAKRDYENMTYLGKKQSDKEYSSSISLWHKQFHFLGLTPKLTFSYSRTDSNISIYSYDKSNVYMNLSKTF